ncbi:MAG: fibronectin type III domain-containing protein [Gemmatimonadales bacterium]
MTERRRIRAKFWLVESAFGFTTITLGRDGMMFGSGSTTRALLGLSVAALVACSTNDNGVSPPPATNNPPTGVAASATGPTTVQVSFTAPSTAASQFVVHRAPGGSGGIFVEVGRPAGSANGYTDTGLTVATTYRYRVAAVRNGVTSAFSAEVSVTTSGPTLTEVIADITTNTTWTSDRTWRIKGFRKVASGATLTIEAGTRIEGDFATVGSSLFVLRGARIVANGTAAAPIVFTSSQPAGQRQPGDWGGLIIIGNGVINRSGTVALEGTGTDPVQNPTINYSGGSNNADNSGTLRYVRVEYAGFGPAQDAELNSFTFAAVGSGTTMDYLESLNGLDDSFEWFGGAADASHLVSYQSGDDHFDMSEGFQGRLQYLIAYQSKQLIPRAGAGNTSSDPQGIENDGCNGSGCDAGHNTMPFTIPVVANFTLVGTEPGVVAAGGGYGMVLRRGTGGHYVNGIIARWPNAGISVRDAGTTSRVTEGVMSVRNVLIAESPLALQAGQQTYDLAGNAITFETATTAASMFAKLPTAPTSVADFDWSLSAAAAARTGGLASFTGDLAAKAGVTIMGTTYRGAWNPAGTKWWEGWTSYSNN